MCEDKWLIKNEFEDNFSFKISSPGTLRICGFNLFTRLYMMSGFRRCHPFSVEIRNKSSGRSLLCQTHTCPMRYKRGVGELHLLSHWKLEVGDPAFDDRCTMVA